jgi:hypothetical protein
MELWKAKNLKFVQNRFRKAKFSEKKEVKTQTGS